VTAHPAALVLADHQPVYVTASTQPGSTVRCSCDTTVQWCDFATHQTEALVAAGLLTDEGGTSPAMPPTSFVEGLARRTGIFDRSTVTAPYACRTCGRRIEGISAPAGRKVTPESALLPVAPVVLSAVPCEHVIPEDQLAAMSQTTQTWPTT
jgi:hypothetical protein